MGELCSLRSRSYDTGQISNILLMPDFLLRFAVCQVPTSQVTDATTQCAFYPAIEGLVVALLSVGTAIGALCGAPIADGLGRRRAMSVECLVFSVGVVIQVTAMQAWYQVASTASPLSASSMMLIGNSWTLHLRPRHRRPLRRRPDVPSRDLAQTNPRHPHGDIPALHHIRYPRRLPHLARHARLIALVE